MQTECFSGFPEALRQLSAIWSSYIVFWNSGEARQTQDSLAFSEIAFAAGSPGSVFKLDENSIAIRLERLERLTNGGLIYDETSGLQQVYRRVDVGGSAILARYYEELQLLPEIDMKLNQVVTIAPRYTRSVSLERDIEDPSAVTGYVLTPIGADFLRRIHRVLTGAPGPRAWSITGPYGSGKSAFVLFLVNLLSGTRTRGAAESQKILKNTSPDLASDLLDQRKPDSIRPSGFCPVFVSGAANRIAPALLESTIRDVSKFTKKANHLTALRLLQKLAKEVQRGVAIDLALLISAIKQLTLELRKAEKCQGIVIVADELGKFLEFATHHPEENDLFLLQLLAEATVCNGKPDLLFVTVLHQAFEQYASGLRPVLRNEWSKVQGRFEDVAFQDAPEETLRIISSAIVQEPSPLIRPIKKRQPL